MNRNTTWTAIIVYLLIFVLGVTGWVKNFSKLTDCDFESPYKCEVIRVVGIVPIIGAFTGYMDFEGK